MSSADAAPATEGAFADLDGSKIERASALRQAFGSFVTGVTVVTTKLSDGTKRGFTANSFTSVSLDPPLLLVCLANKSGSFDAFMKTDGFAVSVLADAHMWLSEVFARSREDRFSALEWGEASTGSPLVTDALAWFDCRVTQRINAGDHVILVGEVLDFATCAGPPLVFHGGSYVNLDLERRAAVLENDSVVDAALLLEKDGGVLLRRTDKGWKLPTGSDFGREVHGVNALLAAMSASGIHAQSDFVFSISAKAGANTRRVYYRGRLQQLSSRDESWHVVDVARIPWEDLLRRPDHRSVLERYVQERTSSIYRLYVGDDRGGTIL